MSLAVCACLFEWAALLDGAVEADDVVVAHHLEASLLVPAVDVFDGEVFALNGGRAVDDDFVDRSHDKVIFL